MHYLTLLLLLIGAVHGDQISPQNPLEKKIQNFLLKWREGSADTDSFPVPSLKCLTIPEVQYYYEGKGIRVNYTIGKMELKGLDAFSIEDLFASNISLEVAVSLHFPLLTLSAENYTLSGRAYYIYPLKGSGTMQVILRDTVLMAALRFGSTAKGAGTTVQDLLLDFKIKKIEANLQHSSWPINKILSSEGVDILRGYHETIVQALWNYVVPIVNDFLVGVQPSNILDKISETT